MAATHIIYKIWIIIVCVKSVCTFQILDLPCDDTFCFCSKMQSLLVHGRDGWKGAAFEMQTSVREQKKEHLQDLALNIRRNKIAHKPIVQVRYAPQIMALELYL